MNKVLSPGVCLIILSLAPVSTVLSEGVNLVVPGVRIRVTAADPGVLMRVATGTVTKVGPESLTLVDPDRNRVFEIPVKSITRLQWSHGQRRHARIGLLAGAGLGAVWGATAHGDCGLIGYHQCTNGDRASFAVALGGMLGGLGALIGHFIRTEKWSDVPLQRVRLANCPERARPHRLRGRAGPGG